MVSTAGIVIIVILAIILLALIGWAIWYAIGPSVPSTTSPTSGLVNTNQGLTRGVGPIQPVQPVQPIQPIQQIQPISVGQVQPVSAEQAEELAAVPSENFIKYGDIVRIRNTDANSGGYLSPCGILSDNDCGVNVTIRSNESYQSEGSDTSRFRDWIIEGGAPGANVKYGDTVRIKGSITRLSGSELYLSPCGSIPLSIADLITRPTCGINVSLRNQQSYQTYGGDASGLRDWRITAGTVGLNIPYNSSLQLVAMADATRFPNHNKPLAICGTAPDNCGRNVSLGDTLNTWVIEKVPDLNGPNRLPLRNTRLGSPV